MAEARTHIFISATTKDLGSYRLVIRDELLTAGFFPILQEHFPPDKHSLGEFIERAIAPCDAVICLLGPCLGSGPRPTNGVERSYTQMEYDIATLQAKPLYAFIASEKCDVDVPLCEDDRSRELQRRHIEAVMNARKCQFFSSKEDLRQHVLRLIPLLPKAVGNSKHRSSRFVHLPREPAFFAGRQEELRQLASAIRRPTPCVVAVLGIGGQGKTSLVWQWLKQHGTESFAGVLWCTAYRNGFTFDMFLDEALGYLLGDQFDKRNYPDVELRSRRLVECMQSANLLFVIDGLERWLKGWACEDALRESESTGDRTEAHKGLDDFLAQVAALGNGTHVVLTSRALPACLEGAAYALIPVDPDGKGVLLDGLDDDAAVALLKGIGVMGGADELLSVTHRYSNHPLALSVLGALITEGYGGRIDRLADVSALDHKQRLFELLEETRIHLPGQDLPIRFLQIAAQFIENPSLVPLSAIMLEDAKTRGRGGLSNGDMTRQLREVTIMLAKWNLIGWDAAREVIQLHPLVKEYFGGLAHDDTKIHQRLARWYAQQPIPTDASTMAHARTRLLAVEHALRAEASDLCEELLFLPMAGMGSFPEWMAMWGHLNFGIELFGRLGNAMRGYKRSWCAISRGAMLRQLGRLEESVAILTEAIDSLTGLLQIFSLSRRMDLCGAYINRGNAQRELGELTLGLRDYDQALKHLPFAWTCKSTSSFLRGDILINRGNTLRDLGRLTEAITDCSMAIAIYSNFMRRGMPNLEYTMASAFMNRANVYADAYRFEEAEKDYQTAFGYCDEMISHDRKEALPILAHLHVMHGATLTDANRAAEAVPEIMKGADILQKCVDQGRSDMEPALGLAWMNMGHAHLQSGNALAAVGALDKAVTIFARLTRAGRRDVVGWLAWSLMERAAARVGIGQNTEAKDDRVEGLRLLRKLIADDYWVFHVSMIKKLAQAALSLVQIEPTESAELVNAFVAEAISGLGSPHATEKYMLELRKEIGMISKSLAALDSCHFHREGWSALCRRMDE